MRIVAGRHRKDRSVEILDDGTLEILGLKSLPGPTTSRCAVETKGATNAAIVAGAS
jgi:hypothetical protein